MRKQYLFVKNGSSYEKAPDEYDENIVYYVPSNSKVIGFEDDEYVEIQWNDFDITVAGAYDIRLVVDQLSREYKLNVVEPSPKALEVYPSEDDVRKDLRQGTYYVYQDETLHITEWDYKIRLNNDAYSAINGSYSDKITSEMYVGSSFMTNHVVGVYNYDFSFMSGTGALLTCTVPIEVRQRTIVTATATFPTKNIYSVGDSISLAGGFLRARYINGEEREVIPFSSDMVYEPTTGTSDVNYVVTDPSGEQKVLVPLKKSDLSAFTRTYGQSTVYLYYRDSYYDTGYVVRFDVTVIPKAVSISLRDGIETKSDYILGEAFTSRNWEVDVVYEEGFPSTENDFSDNRWTWEGTDFSTVGQHVVKLYYGDVADDVSLSYTCYVHNEVATVSADKDFIGYTVEGKDFDFSSVVFTAVRENGDEETVPFSAFTVSATKAGVYDPVPSAYVVADFVKESDWTAYNTFFYVKNGGDFVPAGATYDPDAEYYCSADDRVEISFSYKGKSTVVTSLVVSRRLVSVAVVAEPLKEYTKTSNDVWDLTDLSLKLTFDNSTTAVLKHRDSGASVSFADSDTGVYHFTLNGMEYFFTLKDADGTAYRLADLKTELDHSTDEYVEKRLAFSVLDGVYLAETKTSELPFYCFKKQVYSIHVEVGVGNVETVSGEQKVTSVTPYADSSVYVNEGLDFYTVTDGSYSFVNDGGAKRFV